MLCQWYTTDRQVRTWETSAYWKTALRQTLLSRDDCSSVSCLMFFLTIWAEMRSVSPRLETRRAFVAYSLLIMAEVTWWLLRLGGIVVRGARSCNANSAVWDHPVLMKLKLVPMGRSYWNAQNWRRSLLRDD